MPMRHYTRKLTAVGSQLSSILPPCHLPPAWLACLPSSCHLTGLFPVTFLAVVVTMATSLRFPSQPPLPPLLVELTSALQEVRSIRPSPDSRTYSQLVAGGKVGGRRQCFRESPLVWPPPPPLPRLAAAGCQNAVIALGTTGGAPHCLGVKAGTRRHRAEPLAGGHPPQPPTVWRIRHAHCCPS